MKFHPFSTLVKCEELPPHYNEIVELFHTDDAAALGALYANPSFDAAASYDLMTLLQWAIGWKAIKCFNFIMINGGSRSNALQFAVAAGRIEMIELLLQDGCVILLQYTDVAIETHQHRILEWMIDRSFATLSERHMMLAIKARNRDAVSFLQERGLKVRASHVSLALNRMEDIALEWARQGVRLDWRHAFMHGSIEFCKAIPLTEPQKCLIGALLRNPFSEELADLAIENGASLENAWFHCTSPEAFAYFGKHNPHIVSNGEGDNLSLD